MDRKKEDGPRGRGPSRRHLRIRRIFLGGTAASPSAQVSFSGEMKNQFGYGSTLSSFPRR